MHNLNIDAHLPKAHGCNHDSLNPENIVLTLDNTVLIPDIALIFIFLFIFIFFVVFFVFVFLFVVAKIPIRLCMFISVDDKY